MRVARVGAEEMPVARVLDAWLVSPASRELSRSTSTRWPRPVRSRSRSASRMPDSAFSPVSTSTTATPTLVGAASGWPVMLMRPPTACTSRSYPASAAPCSRPNPVIEQYTSPGLAACRVAASSPYRSMTPGRKFSTTTSADAASARAVVEAVGRAQVADDGALVAVDRVEVGGLRRPHRPAGSRLGCRRRRGFRP